MIPLELIVCDNKDQIYQYIFKRLKKIYCSNGIENCFCIKCRKIEDFIHPNCILIDPEGSYSVKDIEIIFEKVAFHLGEGEHFFFILLNVQYLNVACANRLLKIFEEPPTGYNFILSTNNLSLVLPTIVSRCLINRIESQSVNFSNPLLELFYEDKYDPIRFEATLRDLHINDEESSELLNYLYFYYSSKLKNFYLKSNNNSVSINREMELISKKVFLLENYLQYLPQSGSSIMFWRNLYMLLIKQI